MDYTQSNVLSMTGGTDFATVADLTNYVDLTTNQTITSGIKIFTALPQASSAPTTGNQLTNKTYVDGLVGNYVTLTTTQTISGLKTFSGNVRINNSRGLILGTTTGGFIGYTTPNVYYDVTGGSHYFFVGGLPSTRVETGGLFIENGKYINWFGGSWLYENNASSRFEYNVPTGFNHSLRINNLEKLKLDDDGNGSTLTFPSGALIREYTPFSWLFHNVPLGWIYKWDIDGTTALQLSSSGLLVAGGGTISIQTGSGGSLILDDAFVGGRISGTGGNVRFDADIGGDFKFVCDSTLALTINSLGISVPNNLVAEFGVANCNIGYASASTSLRYRVPTGTYYHRWFSGTTELMSLSSVAFYGLRTTDIDIFLTRGKHLYMDTSNNGIWIDLSGNFNAMSDPTKSIVLYAGAQQVVSVDATGLIMGVSSLPSTFPKIYADYSKANWIDGNATSLRFNCGSIGSHVFLLNNTLLGTYATAGFAMNVNNMAISIGATNVCSIRQNTTLTSMGYNVPTGYTHKHNINSVLHSEITPSGLKITTGYYIKQGSGTTIFGSSVFNNYWTGTAYQAWIDGTNVGSYVLCDYRLKENIQPARPVLDRLCQIKMIEYEFKDISIFKKHGRHHGMIAHEVQELFPELDNIVSGEKDAVNESGEIQPQTIQAEFGNLYLTAIQELNAKCIAQQTQMEAMQAQIDGLVLALSKIVSA